MSVLNWKNINLKQLNIILAQNNNSLGETNQNNIIAEWENKSKTASVTYNDIMHQIQTAQSKTTKLKVTKKN